MAGESAGLFFELLSSLGSVAEEDTGIDYFQLTLQIFDLDYCVSIS